MLRRDRLAAEGQPAAKTSVNEGEGPERQSLVDSIASLSFQDRREADGQPATKTSITEAFTEDLGFTVFREIEQPVTETSVGEGAAASQPAPCASAAVAEEAVPGASAQQLPVAAPTEYDGVIDMFRFARQRAAERRLAAVRVLEEARAIESRISEEAEHLRAASAFATKMQPLAEAVERATAHEQVLLDGVHAVKAKCARLADERKRAESARDGLLAAEQAATAEIMRLEVLLARARSNLVDVTTAVASATTELETARSREEAAREEAAAKSRALADVRQTRAEAEAGLEALKGHSLATSGNASSLRFEEQLRALEARIAGLSSLLAAVTNVPPTPAPIPAMSEFEKRLAERRATDAAHSKQRGHSEEGVS